MGCDRISELPDDLLNQILFYLPSKDSVRTSVLSTRWRNLWLRVPLLDLNVPPHGKGLESLLDRFLEFNHGRMQKFKIKYADDLSYLSVRRIVQSIAVVVDSGIQHLDVIKTMNIAWLLSHFMPTNIYKSKTLVSLKLVNVRLKNPEFVVSLPCLKIMHLENIYCRRYKGGPLITEQLISGCPVLEDLNVVKNVITFTPLRVSSQTLKNLCLTFDWRSSWRPSSRGFSVEIDAPGLKYMNFKDSQTDRIVVKNLSSLVKIDLDTNFNVDLSPLEPERFSKRDIIRDFLTSISSVKHMIISQPTLEVLHRYLNFGLSPKFHNLHGLQAAFSSSMLQLLPVFLENCPNLKNLIMEYSVSAKPADLTDLTIVPRCLSSTLEYVEIKELTMKEKTGIKLVNYFLENSAVLKKLTLSLTHSSITKQEPERYKKLLTSTMLSRGCQVLVY